jgi:hypothetical protein
MRRSTATRRPSTVALGQVPRRKQAIAGVFRCGATISSGGAPRGGAGRNVMPHWTAVDWIANGALTLAAVGVLLIIFAKWFR